MLHPVGEQGGGTDDDIVARRQRPGGQVGEHGVGQPIGVGQLIDPLTQGVYRLKLAQHPLPRDAAQEALYRPAGLAVPLLDLPGENAPGPFGHFGLQRRGEQQGAEILPDLGRRRQTAVDPLIAGLIALHTAHQLLAQGLEPRPVVAVAQIDVTLHQPRIFWLHDVGESSTRTVLQGVTPWGMRLQIQNFQVIRISCFPVSRSFSPISIFSMRATTNSRGMVSSFSNSRALSIKAACSTGSARSPQFYVNLCQPPLQAAFFGQEVLVQLHELSLTENAGYSIQI